MSAPVRAGIGPAGPSPLPAKTSAATAARDRVQIGALLADGGWRHEVPAHATGTGVTAPTVIRSSVGGSVPRGPTATARKRARRRTCVAGTSRKTTQGRRLAGGKRHGREDLARAAVSLPPVGSKELGRRQASDPFGSDHVQLGTDAGDERQHVEAGVGRAQGTADRAHRPDRAVREVAGYRCDLGLPPGQRGPRQLGVRRRCTDDELAVGDP